MAYYSSLEQLKNDLNWLSKECTLEHFSYSRLSDYEFANLSGQISKRLDNPFVEDLYNQLLSKIDLQSSVWEDTLSRSMLPVIALIPEVGVQIVIDIDVNGVYKSIDANGTIQNESFPEKTIFRMLKFQSKKSSSNSSGAMFKSIAKKQKKYLYFAIIASVSINTLALGVAFYTMQVYDRVVSTNGMSTLIALTIGVGIALILELILKFSRGAIVDQATKIMDIAYAHNTFYRFLNIRSDNLPKGIGTLSSKINGYTAVRSFVVNASMFLIIDFPFAFFFLFVISLIGSFKVGLLILSFALTSVLAGFLFKNKIEVATKTSNMAAHAKQGLLVESVENSIKIKTAGANWSVMNKWNQLTDDAADDDLLIKHYTDMSGFLAVFIQQASYVSTVAFGAYLIGSNSNLTMGSLIAITILANKVFQPMTQIPGLFVQWAKAKVAVEDLDGLYAMASDNENVDRPVTLKLQSYDIACVDVKFAYNKDQLVLNIPKLLIRSGEKVAIVGTIGAGKSTLIKLLSGIYKPKVGRVSIDNIDMQQISRDNLTNTIGYLDQDTKLFSGTFRDNLTIGLVNVTDEQIIEFSKLTGLIGLITQLPKGLDTLVPEGGQTVSGGQRQLIALTRILIADSKVLLLDEPTASMDELTEQRILQTLLKTTTKEQTLIIVTHKKHMLKLVDRVIILDNNVIVADGKKEDVFRKVAEINAATIKKNTDNAKTLAEAEAKALANSNVKTNQS